MVDTICFSSNVTTWQPHGCYEHVIVTPTIKGKIFIVGLDIVLVTIPS